MPESQALEVMLGAQDRMGLDYTVYPGLQTSSEKSASATYSVENAIEILRIIRGSNLYSGMVQQVFHSCASGPKHPPFG
ncbi:hypothetical protein SLE2022_221740 [Rubroshorea leprosula]